MPVCKNRHQRCAVLPNSVLIYVLLLSVLTGLQYEGVKFLLMLHIQKDNERSFHWPLCGWIRALVAALEPPFPRFPCFVLSFVVMLNVSLLSISPPLSWVSPPLSLTLSLFAFLTISECSFHSLSTNDLTDRE